MTSSEIHSRRATAALQKLIEFDPAFGSLSLWCLHRDAAPEDGLALACDQQGNTAIVPIKYEIAAAFTDGQTIYYGSEFETWTLNEQLAVCAHEILHIAFQHVPRADKLAARLGARYSNPLFNIAADALINESLTQAGYTLPKPHVALADVLTKVLKSAHSPKDALSILDVESLYMKLLHTAEAGGKGAMELAGLCSNFSFDLFRGRESGKEIGLEAAEWDQRLQRALQAGTLSGRGLGTVATRLGDIPKSQTPWEVILRRMVTKAVTHKPQVTFGSPTRRWLALDSEAQRTMLPQPGFEPDIRRAPVQHGHVAVCVDVSGSISQSTLTRFSGEIDGISRRTGAHITLIIFDDGVHLVKELNAQNLERELKSLTFKSGGGTSFVEPIQEALKHDPSIIVVLTDLCGPFGTRPRRIPVVWACNAMRPPPAPFGRVIALAN